MRLFRDRFATVLSASVVSMMATVTALAFLSSQQLNAQDVVVSELMARNTSTLLDEDGEYSDWAELYNGTSETVNLDGWYLSDDSSDLTRWRLPGVELSPASYLIVFLSGKDRADPSGELHASFKLSGEGEFFGLTAPDGRTTSAVLFPRQLPDHSYGFAQEAVQSLELVSVGAPGKVLVPLDGSLGLDWTNLDFDDAGWIEGQSGFGFDEKARPTYEECILTTIGDEMRGVNATAYIRIPFEVDDPTVIGLLQLGMQYEDGFIAYLNGVEIARAQAPEGASWDSDATSSGSSAAAKAGELFDVSASKGLLTAGTNMLAIHGLNKVVTNSDFFVLPTLLGIEVGPVQTDAPRYFDVPTPSWPNGTGFPGVSDDPAMSLPGGLYEMGAMVDMSTRTPGAVIRYTLDGTNPDSNSPLYMGPIELQSSVQVVARSFAPDLLPSAPVRTSYVLMAEDILDFSSNLPLFVVSTFGGSISNWVPAHFHVMEPGADGRTAFGTDDEPNYSGAGRVKTRGSSTGSRLKASLSLELWEAENDPVDVELLGLPAESDWILYGPYNFDRANIRNALMYELSNRVGEYAPRTRFVEVFVNKTTQPLSSSHYFGFYVFIEKIKQGEGRVDVGRLEPFHDSEPEITGGYIIKWDRPDPGDVGFNAGGEALKYVYPKEQDITPAQAAWLKDYLDTFNAALRGPDAEDPDVGFEAYADVLSFIDVNLLNEFAKEGDALSTYYNKPKNGKFRAGPLWDYDRTLNSDDDFRSRNPEGWSGIRGRNWWGGMLAQPGFHSRYRDRWIELRAGPLSTANVFDLIDSMADEIREAQGRNFQKWTGLVNGNGIAGWETEIQQLKTWIERRVNWIDAEFLEAPVFNVPGGMITPPVEIELTNPNVGGEIVYTLNGPDPQLPNDAMAPEAVFYAGPFTIEDNTRVRTRVLLDGNVWSDLGEEVYVATLPSLAISEFNYEPTGGTPFEFVELLNFGDEPIDLTGMSFASAIRFDFEEGTLQPGEYTVIVKDLEDFSTLYFTDGIQIAGEYTGTLSNRGETVTLAGTFGEPVVHFRYDEDWHPETNGGGHSLVLIDPNTPRETWTEAAAWRGSAEVNGSPGRADPTDVPDDRQRPGDADQDGKLDLRDPIHLLSFLFTGTVGPLPCGDGTASDAGNVAFLDTNGDGRLNAADAVYSLDFLFRDGPMPAQGQECIAVSGCPGAAVCE